MKQLNIRIAELNKKLIEVKRDEDIIYPMYEIDTVLKDKKPFEILKKGYWGEFDPIDDYFYLDAYENITTMNKQDVKNYIKELLEELDKK